MDLITIIQLLLGLLIGGLGYWLSRLADQVKAIEDKTTQCMVSLPERYVLKDDYKSDINEVKQTLRDIFSILRKTSVVRTTDELGK